MNTLYDEPQAAEHLHVSQSFLQKKRLTGDGPAYLKLGRSIRYRPGDLEAWLEGLRRRSTSDPSPPPEPA
jgi:hypothetical protein